MFTWITELIHSIGYIGVIVGMFLENIFPPIPSELIMMFSGAAAVDGKLNIILVIIAGAVGSTLGLIPWYYLARSLGEKKVKIFAERYGRWLAFTPDDVSKAHTYFEKYKEKILFIGRFLPAVRTFVAIPAGIIKTPLKIVLFYGFFGALVWDGTFGIIGYFIGSHAGPIIHVIDTITYITFGIIILWYFYRVIIFK